MPSGPRSSKRVTFAGAFFKKLGRLRAGGVEQLFETFPAEIFLYPGKGFPEWKGPFGSSRAVTKNRRLGEEGLGFLLHGAVRVGMDFRSFFFDISVRVSAFLRTDHLLLEFSKF